MATVSTSALLDESARSCDICTGDCIGFPDTPHRHDYPFLRAGTDPMAEDEYVVAPHRIDDPDLERAVYGVGDRVPIADAVRYGLIDKPSKPPPAKKPARKATRRAKRGPEDDRAKKPGDDR